MAKSQTIARLEVQTALNAAGFSAGATNVAIEANKLKNSIAREMRSAEKEIQTLKYATEDYGKTVTRVTQLERDLQSGRYKNLGSDEQGRATIARLREQARAYDEIATKSKMAATGGLTDQQKLALTYQTTDLVTQLASGQNAMIALLQQGGQLKDQLGGIGNMFRILGSFITPVNVAIAAVATTVGSLAVAFYKGAMESAKFRDNLILTNNYAKLNADSFQRMANVISKNVNMSIGDSKDVLFELISSGQFTSQSMDSVAQAILNVSKLTGQTAKEVSKSLIPAFDGSASSAKRLNDQYHFLSLAQYKQIELLEKQGKLQESAKLAADAFNSSISGQTRQLGILEKSWEILKNAASSAWDAMLGIGRDTTVEEELKKVQDQIEKYEKLKGNQASNPEWVQKQIEEQRLKADALNEQIRLRNRAIQKKDDTAAIEDYAKWNQKRVDLSLEATKLESANTIEWKKRTETEIGKLELDAQLKLSDLDLQYKKKNEDEAFKLFEQNERKKQAESIKILRDMDKAIAEVRLKRYINEMQAMQEYKDQRDQEVGQYLSQKDAERQAIIDKYETQQKSLENDKQKLELQQQSIFMSEKEQKIAMIDLELQQKIAEIKRSTATNFDKDWQIKQEIDQSEMKKNLVGLTDSFSKMKEMSDSVWSNMSNALETFVRTGKLSFRDLARSIIQDLLLIQIKAQALSIFNFVASMITASPSTIGPRTLTGYASGGEPPVNTPVLVGEKGPEIFMPRSAGTIIPNSQLGMGSTNVTNNYINAIDTKSFEERLMGSSRAIWAANTYAQKSLAVGTGRM